MALTLRGGWSRLMERHHAF